MAFTGLGFELGGDDDVLDPEKMWFNGNLAIVRRGKREWLPQSIGCSITDPVTDDEKSCVYCIRFQTRVKQRAPTNNQGNET